MPQCKCAAPNIVYGQKVFDWWRNKIYRRRHNDQSTSMRCGKTKFAILPDGISANAMLCMIHISTINDNFLQLYIIFVRNERQPTTDTYRYRIKKKIKNKRNNFRNGVSNFLCSQCRAHCCFYSNYISEMNI